MRLRVEDDEVGPNPLGAPVFMRHEQLPNALQACGRANRREDDRPVSGDPLRPKGGLTARDGRALRLGRTKRLVWIDEGAGELVIERDVGRHDIEIAQLDLGLARARLNARSDAALSR